MASTAIQRTPTNRAPAKKGDFDLGAFVTEKTGYDPAEQKPQYRNVALWENSFRFAKDPSIFALLAIGSGETNEIVNGLLAVVHEDDRKEFQRTLVRLNGLDPEGFLAILEGLVEMYTEGKESARSGASSRTTPRKAVSKRSTAG